MQLPDPAQWRAWGADDVKRYTDIWQADAGLNFWEAELVAKYMRATDRPMQKLFPVYVTVESPRRADRNPLRFNVGYVIGDLEVQGRQAPVFSLHYMRIQNHLRKMGLARDALIALGKDLKVALDVPAPLFDAGKLDQSASDEALPTDDAVTRLRAIIRSLP